PHGRLLPARRRLLHAARCPCAHGSGLQHLVATHPRAGRCHHRVHADLLSGDAADRRHFLHRLRHRIQGDQLFGLVALHGADQGGHVHRHRTDAVAGHRHLLQGFLRRPWGDPVMSYELIALLMFSSMMLLLLTGKRVFGAIGFVAAAAALLLWGDGGSEMAFSAAMKLMKWYPLLTLPMFVFMGYMLSESGIAEDLYKMFHVWMGPL